MNILKKAAAMLARVLKFFVVSLAFMLLGVSCSKAQESSPQTRLSIRPVSGEKAAMALPFADGEAIRYAIKNLGINAGEATLVFGGRQKLNNTDVYLITFTAKAMKFFDEEKIYADAATFYPVVVKRDLNIWGKKEKITEEYDRKQGIIKITKTVGGKTSQQVIKKSGRIDNIYCFIYRYRASGKFRVGDSLLINLPTADVKIDLAKMTQLKTPAGTYEAYYMQSSPGGRYRVWFDTSTQKIPLRINGTVGINDTAMVMVACENEKDREIKENAQNAAR